MAPCTRPPELAPDVAALLIVGSGRNEPTYVAELLAGERMAALSVAHFGKDGLPPALGDIELGYFRTALDLLRSELDRRDLAVVVMGQSRGSEAAMLTAVHFAELVDAVVVTVPSDVVLSGYPMGGPAPLLDGAPLPYAEDFGPDCDPCVIIPVELVRGPIMFVSAGHDEIWPSASMARALSERLVKHGDAHGHELLEYADASHSLGYLRPSLPAGLMLGDLNDPTQTRAARADAWPKVLRFIQALATEQASVPEHALTYSTQCRPLKAPQLTKAFQGSATAVA